MVNKIPEVGRDNLLDPGEAGPEVNHLLEAGHFIFHTLIRLRISYKRTRERKVKQEKEIV
jgi:hypothetical protein